MNLPRIALFDIESAPSLGWVWSKWETNVIEFEQQSYMLCFSVKWLDTGKIEIYSLPDFPLWQREQKDKARPWYKHNDKELVMKLWEIMGEAEIIVAHNGDAFDMKYSNGRMIVHGLPPPPDYKTVDTLKLARRNFKFLSNKLDDIGKDLNIGRKLHHTGIHLWFGCMRGDENSWSLMKRYNKQDVLLLERVYLKFRPWAKNHPDVTVYGTRTGCPKCGTQKTQKRGFHYTRTLTYQIYYCRECRASYRGETIKHGEQK